LHNYKAYIKDIFYKTKFVGVLDRLIFRFTYYRNRKKNASFLKANPGLIIPPDYFLYETYRLDYEQFFKDGEETAKEIIDWTKNYVPQTKINVLDWGCGVSRVIMHIDKFTDPSSSIYGCDINEKMIEFDKQNYKNISYSVVPNTPPTKYGNDHFDLIYALSVFTHIKDSLQELSVKEIYRILKKNGLFLFTTHGTFFNSKLLPAEKKELDNKGVFTKSYTKEGHRMMSTYNSEEAFRKLLYPYFEILEFHDGSKDKSKTGGQDLWIVRKLH
jgi:ubiquinone/menaquinone biosynthesis C-methylase UbiE